MLIEYLIFIIRREGLEFACSCFRAKFDQVLNMFSRCRLGELDVSSEYLGDTDRNICRQGYGSRGLDNNLFSNVSGREYSLRPSSTYLLIGQKAEPSDNTPHGLDRVAWKD